MRTVAPASFFGIFLKKTGFVINIDPLANALLMIGDTMATDGPYRLRRRGTIPPLLLSSARAFGFFSRRKALTRQLTQDRELSRHSNLVKNRPFALSGSILLL